MSTLISTALIPGKSIIGYKVYSVTTNKYAGASAGIVGAAKVESPTTGNRRILFNFHGKTHSTGDLTYLYIGLEATAGIDISVVATLRVYTIDTSGGGEPSLTLDDSIDVPIFFMSTAENPRTVLSIPLSSSFAVTAGQVFALDIPYSSSGSYYIYTTYDYSPYYDYATSGGVYDTIAYSDITNSEYLDTPSAYSFEGVGDWTTSWAEVTDGFVGLTGVATTTETLNDIKIDIGANTQLAAIQFSSATFYEYNVEILISEYDGESPPDASWISVYYGEPQNYGNILSLGAGYIGFPFMARHVRCISANPGAAAETTITLYEGITAHNGSYFPKSIVTGTEYLLVDTENNDALPTWYSVVPVLASYAYGTISTPISNRINL